MTEVGRPVDGGPAHVHRHPPRVPGLEGQDLTGRGVEQADHDDAPYRRTAGPLPVLAAVIGPPALAAAAAAASGLGAPVTALVALGGSLLGAAAVTAGALRPLRSELTAARLELRAARDRLRAAEAARDLERRTERALALAATEAETLRAGLRAVAERAPEGELSLLLATPDGAGVGWSAPFTHGALQPARPVTGQPGCLALATGATVRTASSRAVEACPHLADRADEVSATCLPVRVDGRLLGAVCLAGAPGDLPDSATTAGIEWLLERTAARLTDQRRRRGPSRPGPDDPVTGLPTEAALRAQLRDLVRSLVPFSAAVVAVDGAEQLRDRHGPAALDEAVALVADTLGATLRPDDLVCRLDGPRLAAVLTGCEPEQAVAALERAREALVLAAAASDARPVTCSAGVVASHWVSSLDEILRTADAACVAAHLQGGNRVLLAEQPSHHR